MPARSTHTNFSKFLVTIVIFLSIAVIVLGWLVFQKFIQESKDYPIVISQTEEAIINNEDPIAPELSTQEIAQIQADRITEETNDNQESDEQKSYTNQFYQDFEIVYPEDWELSTTTSQSQYNGLLNREIKLTKNNSELFFNLYPLYVGGCGPSEEFLGMDNSRIKLANGLKEFNSEITDSLYYSYEYACDFSNIVTTTIPKGNIPEYLETFPDDKNDDKTVRYVLRIQTNIIEKDAEENPELDEIRKILENSTIPNTSRQ